MGNSLLTDPSLLLAVVSDDPLDIDIPRYSRNDIDKIADLIEEKIRQNNREDRVSLVIDGTPRNLSPEDEARLRDILLQAVPGINGDDIKNLHVSLRRKL